MGSARPPPQHHSLPQPSTNKSHNHFPRLTQTYHFISQQNHHKVGNGFHRCNISNCILNHASPVHYINNINHQDNVDSNQANVAHSKLLIINVKLKNNITARALLDCGSTTNFISKRFCYINKLPTINARNTRVMVNSCSTS